jgi:predicted peptidase
MLAALVMTGHFVAHTVTVDGAERRYEVWLPAAYDAARRWPAILFLHGAGERGDDGVAQTTVGLGHALRDGTVDPQAIVVFPQCPLGKDWVGSARKIAVAALEQVIEDYAVDQHRVSLTGISMGGAGAWALASEQPRRFAALAPVCGWVHRPAGLTDLGDVADRYETVVKKLGRMPIWIFHGEADTVVPVDESRTMASLLGANAAYTEFPGVKHNSWDPAYETTGVVEWLVKQKRP